ncbi:MAG: hypothetical protein ABIJ34_04305 [archaeon]
MNKKNLRLNKQHVKITYYVGKAKKNAEGLLLSLNKDFIELETKSSIIMINAKYIVRIENSNE